MAKLFFEHLFTSEDKIIAQALIKYGFTQVNSLDYKPTSSYILFQFNKWEFHLGYEHYLSACSPNYLVFDLDISEWLERGDYRSTLLDEELVPKIKKAISKALKKANKEWQEKHRQLSLF